MRQRKNMTENQLANLKGVKNRKPKVTEEKLNKEERKRRDWELNNELIHTKYTELFLKNQRPPTITLLAKTVGMSWRAVHEHMENYDFEELKKRFRMGNPAVYMNMFKNAATSKNPKWAELWLRWSGDIQDKVDVTSGGKPIEGNHSITMNIG